MSIVFANIKHAVPVLDPETRKVVSQNTKDINKGFDSTVTLAEVWAWARQNKSLGCQLLFETEESCGE